MRIKAEYFRIRPYIKIFTMQELKISPSLSEIHQALIFDSPNSAKLQLKKSADELAALGAKIITLEVFGGSGIKPAIEEFTKDAQYPINWICPLNEKDKPELAGAHITAVKGAEPKFKRTPSGSAAVEYSDEYGSYCRTFGVTAPRATSDGYQHTIDNLNELEDTLWLFGYKYNDIARTWFYNDDILAWYAPFNKARTDFYTERKIFDGLLPASTGIGAPNPTGKKIMSGAIAIKSPSKKISVCELESPLQCGAPKYGSSFSRAVEISTPISRRIMVSGTASIEPGGKTAFVGDIERQVDLTMKVISAILESRGMTLKNTVRSVAYCLRPEYYEVFKAWMAKGNLNIAHCPSFSIVCRDDLLFEVELEAFAENS